MKRELLNPKLILATAVSAVLLTGCASVDRGFSDVNGPSSALAFTTVTDPNQTIKWTGDRFLQLGLRGMDTYYFQVPETGYHSGAAPSAAGGPGVYTTGSGSGDITDRNTVAVVQSGPYQTETRSFKIIQYRPGH